MDVVYPGLESPEFHQAFAALVEAIGAFGALLDALGISAPDPETPITATVAAFEQLLPRLNAIYDQVETVGAYIFSFVTTDSRDTVAQAKRSELLQHLVRLGQFETRVIAWLGSLDVDTLLTESELAREHAFFLRRTQEAARHLMSPAEEDLAEELNLVAGAAWSQLHGTVTSQIVVDLERDGATDHLPMSMIRRLAHDPDRDVRRHAYNAELAAWERWAAPLAAALNSIKGEMNILCRRRRWDSPLDQALHDNHIDRATLDAMMAAAHDAFPTFRRYFRAKARLLGVARLAWFDLFAPVGADGRAWSFDEGVDFIVAQFATFSPRMSGLAARAFRERWIDAEPRAGKRDGAFCMTLRADESRILANYTPGFDSVSTLAHELGHAYHNFDLAGRTALQKRTPMTLAETASIFCENIITQAGIAVSDAQGQLAILEAWIQGSTQVVVDIVSRFLFEQRVFAARERHELSVDDFCALMREAQLETYGDALDPELLHPYMWAVKGHYYGNGFAFYNFPYMFGLLFGLGLYARYQVDPETFGASYDDLLASTGLADAASLAARYGIDIRSKDFWQASLGVLGADIDRFEALVDAAG
jgi:pepF/M3 family oligoendopeptidase